MKKSKMLLTLLSVLAVALPLASCNPENPGESTSVVDPSTTTESDPTTVDTIEVDSITVTPNEASLEVGDTLQLVYSVLPENATDKTLTFTSSNDVVSVTQTGLITANKAGSAEILIKSINNKTATVNVNVEEKNPYENLNVTELNDVLKETPYAIKEVTSDAKYGLANTGSVGVLQDEIKERFAMKADEEFDAANIIDVSSISIAEVNSFYPEVVEINNFYKLQTAVYLAKAINDKGELAKIKLPGGVFEVEAYLSTNNFAINVDGLNGTYFEGNDTTISVLTKYTYWKGYFGINNSSNIYFHSINLDAKVPSAVTGSITAGNAQDKKLTIKIDKEFNSTIKEVVENNRALNSWVEFGQINKTPLEGGNFIVNAFNGYTVTGNDDEGYSLEVSFSSGAISRPRNGTLVAAAFSQYDSQGILVGSSNDIYFENVKMYHASGMALVSSSTKNLYLNRFGLVKKENSASLMTATADGLHFNEMSGNVEITNSIFEYSHDDALNIKHGYWYKLTAAEGGSTKTMSVSKITSTVREPKAGDKIAVYNEETFEGHNPTKGYYTIDTVTKTAAGYDFTIKERMSQVAEWGNCRVTFLSDTPNLIYRNNIVRNKRNRGILVQVPGAIIENNAFMYVGHGSIQAASAMDQYNEATLPQALSIKNNKFIGNCYIKPEPLYGDISIFAISNNASVAPKSTLIDTVIENNFIYRNGNAAVSLRGTGDITVKDNLFAETSYTQPNGEAFNTIFQVVNSENVKLDGNYSHYSLEKGLAGVTCEGNTAPSDVEIMSNNSNIDYKPNGEAGPVVDVKKATSSISVDGNLSDWLDFAHNIEILGISDAEGTKRTAEEVSDHFKINKLMMTYDDNGIYFGFDIFDNEIKVRTVNDFWLGDCVELFMSSVVDLPSADMQVYKERGGVLQAAFAPTWTSNNFCTLAEVRTTSAYMDRKDELKVSFNVTDNGYVGEVLIPFTFAPEYKTAIDEGKQINIAIIVADCERADIGLKRVQMGNVPHFVETYKTSTARMCQYFFK